jgi:hypothetical protein
MSYSGFDVGFHVNSGIIEHDICNLVCLLSRRRVARISQRHLSFYSWIPSYRLNIDIALKSPSVMYIISISIRLVVALTVVKDDTKLADDITEEGKT